MISCSWAYFCCSCRITKNRDEKSLQLQSGLPPTICLIDVSPARQKQVWKVEPVRGTKLFASWLTCSEAAAVFIFMHSGQQSKPFSENWEGLFAACVLGGKPSTRPSRLGSGRHVAHYLEVGGFTWSRASCSSADCCVPARISSRLESWRFRSLTYTPILIMSSTVSMLWRGKVHWLCSKLARKAYQTGKGI